MHPCLCVDEIVRLIAHELVASEGKATSVALACCCKSFEEPVLDVLWQAQEELKPLLRSLSDDIWDWGGCASLTRLPTTAEWVRFRRYARRMRKLRDGDSWCSEALPVLQLCAIDKPLFPNLKTLRLWGIMEEFIPFIPSFLSPRTTAIDITLQRTNPPKEIVTSVIATLPTLCPDLQHITLSSLPREPMITVAASGTFLASNQDALRCFHVDSPLTAEAREVVCKHPDLRELLVVIEGSTPLPTLALPNLTKMEIKYDHDSNWLQGFHGAALGKLASITFYSNYEPIGDFLEAFKRVALTASIPATLLTFKFHNPREWKLDYRSLLPFIQLTELTVGFSCVHSCSSTIDDDIITTVAQTMSRLEILCLGGDPCRTPTGVTAKGLSALAYHCPRLYSLRIHFQVASLDPLAIPRVISGGEPTIPREDCALRHLFVGEMPIPGESTLAVARTLIRIFPRISYVHSTWGGDWDKVSRAVQDQENRRSLGSEMPPLHTSR